MTWCICSSLFFYDISDTTLTELFGDKTPDDFVSWNDECLDHQETYTTESTNASELV